MDSDNYVWLGAVGFALCMVSGIIIFGPNDPHYAPQILRGIMSFVFAAGALMLILLPIIAVTSAISSRRNYAAMHHYDDYRYRRRNYENDEDDNQPSGSFSKRSGRFKPD